MNWNFSKRESVYKNISFNSTPLPNTLPFLQGLPFLQKRLPSLQTIDPLCWVQHRSLEVERNVYQILGVCLANYIGWQLF